MAFHPNRLEPGAPGSGGHPHIPITNANSNPQLSPRQPQFPQNLNQGPLVQNTQNSQQQTQPNQPQNQQQQQQQQQQWNQSRLSVQQQQNPMLNAQLQVKNTSNTPVPTAFSPAPSCLEPGTPGSNFSGLNMQSRGTTDARRTDSYYTMNEPTVTSGYANAARQAFQAQRQRSLNSPGAATGPPGNDSSGVSPRNVKVGPSYFLSGDDVPSPTAQSSYGGGIFTNSQMRLQRQSSIPQGTQHLPG